jgi:hypothetical protein
VAANPFYLRIKFSGMYSLASLVVLFIATFWSLGLVELKGTSRLGLVSYKIDNVLVWDHKVSFPSLQYRGSSIAQSLVSNKKNERSQTESVLNTFWFEQSDTVHWH